MGFKLHLYCFLMLITTSVISYGQNSVSNNIPSKLQAKIPFETEHGSIILKVRLNNNSRILRLLFDTGADGMAIDQSTADSIGLKISRKQNATVVGGNTEIQVSDGNTIHLEDFEIKNQSIAIFKEVHKDVDGIIGNSLTRNYITRVDYDKKELSLYNFGDYQYEKEGTSLPFTIPAGIFLIPASLSITTEPMHTGDFVFDTGASYSVICFRPFVKKYKLLVSGFKAEYNGSTSGMGMITPTFSGRAAAFSISNMPLIKNIPVTLMAGGGQSESWNPGFDGSIGVRLISRYNFTINMQKKEIHFSPNKTFSYPYDFTLGGYIFGFDPDGTLVVQDFTTAEDPKISLKPGTKIERINGLSAQVLLKDSKQLNKLTTLPAGTACIIESVQNKTTFKDTIINKNN